MIMGTDLMHIADALSSDAYYFINGIFHLLLVSNGFLRLTLRIYLYKIFSVFDTPNFCLFESSLMNIQENVMRVLTV